MNLGSIGEKEKNSKLRIDMNLPTGQSNGGEVQRQCNKLIHSVGNPHTHQP